MADHESRGDSSHPAEDSGAEYGSSSYATIVQTDEDASSSREAFQRPRQGRGYGSITQSSGRANLTEDESIRSGSGRHQHPQSPNIGPQSERTRKPSTIRRMSSKPYRGQEFSVDDDAREVEQDNALQQQQQTSIPAQPSPRILPTTTKNSTLRRRNNATAPLTHKGSWQNDDDDFTLPEAGPSNFGEDDLEDGLEDENGDDNDDADNRSEAESFTLRDRQAAINETHPFGIRIWKPALYKKNRSVEKTAEGDIHSSPGGRVNNLLFLVNLMWSFIFGWWLAIAALVGGIACYLCIFSPHAREYGNVFFGLSRYMLYPFGSFVRLESDEHYVDEDEGEGRSISEYEQWQSGDLEHGRLFFGPTSSRSLVGRRRSSIDSGFSEHDSLLGRTGRGGRLGSNSSRPKRRLFGRGEWTLARVVFFAFFYFLTGPLMLLVSLICWFFVFLIPMGRVMNILVDHLRRHPLALSFHYDSTYTRLPSSPSSSILLCTYRAAGLRYWKYTIDGTNIFLFNLMSIVVFVIFDYWVLDVTFGFDSWLTHPGLVFTLSLLSIIPLAYFIGQAVASISAQSSMGLGAAINAFFSTVVEVFLYCVALDQGKAQLVEGSLIGSIFAGILFLPGLSMCFGAIRRKTQRFNVKSAGVTSTMLLFAVIAAFGPTLFYQIYGSHELNCRSCANSFDERDCRRCYFSQSPAINDEFFRKAVQPFCWFAAVFLFLSYIIGLWFTLRTHAAVIWATDGDEKKAPAVGHESSMHDSRHSQHPNGLSGFGGDIQSNNIRESQLYKRILGQSLQQIGLEHESFDFGSVNGLPPHLDPSRPKSPDDLHGLHLRGLTEEDNENLARQVAEVAATAATVAARDSTRNHHHRTSGNPGRAQEAKTTSQSGPITEEHEFTGAPVETHTGGGHDAPNWSKTKSAVILLGATVLYAVIAEILVDTVDVVLESVDIDEKFLGITLFALVPNTTEFLNAISFAMNGNIALSMEIGSAYALQVCLLQIPALVLYSAVNARFIDPADLISHSFNLIFPQWDMITVILCVFLLSYVYGEGKSNYFKGSILVLTYLVVIIGFYLSGYNDLETLGIDRFDTLALGSSSSSYSTAGGKFYTVGQGKSGIAFPASAPA
ncbi:calcium permease family membrane transporter [Talaromyces stipitatus ATCC 10500]|uniref:Calcium permease family membrane transporter n=1 Tax=Talaromyces stipitatus (strain ATCC 10500 / CBS 375.48 / QM 6759 / NRRL 1006) TaxID=441959 RepID=B8MA45_TALSN|nr:calcium permease family membrane transporter [Talaromyces stipitatus ATCC 10500]EED18374.1 calcium permease family membrane transporter [Talaromyces stipitatus ATCC 10500]